MATSPTQSCRNRRRIRPAAGFTLLEVLAALLIAATALAYLLQSEASSLRGASLTCDLREAAMLGAAKLQELVAGAEGEASGSFEREGWSWSAAREPYPGGPGLERIVLTVVFFTSAGERTLRLEQLAR